MVDLERSVRSRDGIVRALGGKHPGVHEVVGFAFHFDPGAPDGSDLLGDPLPLPGLSEIEEAPPGPSDELSNIDVMEDWVTVLDNQRFLFWDNLEVWYKPAPLLYEQVLSSLGLRPCLALRDLLDVDHGLLEAPPV